MKKPRTFLEIILICGSLISTAAAPLPQALDPNPPAEPVKLIFIHHSTGENWLTDGYGNLGKELGQNNYFVSDTNYGWGPDAIGDRTDIPNWLEWFRDPRTPEYMAALFNESGQNANYTRRIADPGGENQVILVKSCFPNSDLAGSPNDPPGTYEELSVGGAKYVYNQILQYFAERPDKLFIVITAPPLSDGANAKNARAFNQWLVNDWLLENNYSLNNVAVFDFFNVLTDPDAHHRYFNKKIEHVVGRKNTLHYPSGDDHPSEKGSQKATGEFLPLLNIFYNRWKETTPTLPPAGSSAPADAGEAPPAEQQAQPAFAGLVDDFETENPPGTNGWEPFSDEVTPTSMHCAAESGTVYSGSHALTLDFDVPPGGWATCALFYEGGQNWSSSEGLTFYLHAGQSGTIFDVDIYAGASNSQETYIYTIESPPDSTSGWVPVTLSWSDFHRADWEEGAGEAFNKPDQILGLAFGVSTYPDTSNTGILWIDELALLGHVPTQAMAAPAEDGGISSEGQVEPEPARRLRLPCGAGFALPIVLISLGMGWRRGFF